MTKSMTTASNAELAEELRDLAALCDDMAVIRLVSDAMEARIFEKIMGVLWATKAAAMREAATRLEALA